MIDRAISVCMYSLAGFLPPTVNLYIFCVLGNNLLVLETLPRQAAACMYMFSLVVCLRFVPHILDRSSIEQSGQIHSFLPIDRS